MAQGFADYRLDNVANTIYDFVWNEFCDWYLEIAKVQINTGSDAQKRATRRTLIRTLETILRLMHPITPSSPKSCGRRWLPSQGACPQPQIRQVVLAPRSRLPHPVSQPERIDPDAMAHVNRLKAVVDAHATCAGK